LEIYQVFLFEKTMEKNVCVFYFLVYLLLGLGYLNSTILATTFIIGWNINIQNSSVLLCKLMFYISFVISTILSTVLILASVDRLLISSQNVNTRLYSSKRLAYFTISTSSVFWVITNLHTLIKIDIYEMYPSNFICYYNLSELYINFVKYSLMIFNCLFYLLMIILCILSFKNVRRILAIPQQQWNQIRSMTKKDFQLLRFLFVQDIVYIIFSIFLSIYYVYRTVTSNQIQTTLEQAIDQFLLSFLSFMYHIPFCVNFFIFIIVSKVFRTELKRKVYKIFGKDLMAVREEDNRQKNIGNNNIERNVAISIIVPRV
jgi:hypothetical protein